MGEEEICLRMTAQLQHRSRSCVGMVSEHSRRMAIMLGSAKCGLLAVTVL